MKKRGKNQAIDLYKHLLSCRHSLLQTYGSTVVVVRFYGKFLRAFVKLKVSELLTEHALKTIKICFSHKVSVQTCRPKSDSAPVGAI